MGNTIKVARAVVPKYVDDREILKVSPCNVKEGFGKSKGRVYNDMDSD